MNIGVFLLIEPFASVEVQLQKAKEMGFTTADITDTGTGATMLGTAGFSPVSYQYNDFYESLQTTSYYFRAAYQVLSPLQISLNFNYYQNNQDLYSNMRGGLQLRYSFGS